MRPARSVLCLRSKADPALVADQPLETRERRLLASTFRDQRQHRRSGHRCGRLLGRPRGPELGDLLPGARERIGEYEQQVAGPTHVECRIDRLALVGDDRDALLRHAGAHQRLRENPWYLVTVTVAEVVIAPADVVVEAPR